MPNRPVHFEIQANDMDKMRQFYTSVLGWQSKDAGVGFPYQLLNTGTEEFGIDGALMAQSNTLKDVQNGWVCTVGVADLEKTAAEIEKAGGSRLNESQEIPDIGLHSYFKDPEGNVFGVLQPSAHS